MGLAHLTPDQRERFEERAAIREYDGGQTREVAEREALREALRPAVPAESRLAPLTP